MNQALQHLATTLSKIIVPGTLGVIKMVQAVNKAATGAANPIIQKAAQEDPIPWYRKPNLRNLYFMLFPTCMGIELTSGFDSQLINALQIVPSWQACMNCDQQVYDGKS